ncbi:hypothetical protein NMYAN_100013 [Nitrosomonas nitrosa]|uniref:Uncharacterized protein n=1 Tax=Nitrosomonas nitrosa TaxID=52442 RepID=A0A8H9D943_9PROT|nr:hypothetical protein NMYAN_100013 [Nitrosomonas nitrosa]
MLFTKNVPLPINHMLRQHFLFLPRLVYNSEFLEMPLRIIPLLQLNKRPLDQLLC